MEAVILAANQIFIMFIIILLAVAMYKAKLVDGDGSRVLSNILMYLINPCIIFCSYQKEFDEKLVRGLLISFVLAVIGHIISILTAQIFIRGRGVDLINERMAVIYSNCSFLAIPLVERIYGLEGVFYLTAYITIFNILIWTHGILFMGGKEYRKEAVKALYSPAILTIVIGLVFYFTGIRLPSIVMEPLESISKMNTPVAMIIAGICIAQVDVKKTLGKWRIYLVSFLKLIFVPLCLILLAKPFLGSGIVCGVSVIAAASPVATMCMIFAIRFHKDSQYASELFAISTLLSMGTIPLVLYLLEMIPL
ncbi:MAG: AEC family transporter [Lachnospiraceae bacterium]|nr:AEC family transporter [Lachnospiraceae bacterium]